MLESNQNLPEYKAMFRRTSLLAGAIVGCAWTIGGCAAPKVDFATIVRPEAPPELAAYNVFVGEWTWEAVMLNAEGAGQQWNGTAEWSWILDGRALRGTLMAESGETTFEAIGTWSWHPKKKRYFWGMINNWGYPQHGVAYYDEDAKSWRMDFKSVGLDGTTSYGRYRMTVVDDNTLDWSLTEWADPVHMFKKLEMNGTYKRK